MIKVGQKVEFDPMGAIDGNGAEDYKGDVVIGKVVMVNYKHRWFSVECGEPKARTSFNFADIGQEVKILG